MLGSIHNNDNIYTKNQLQIIEIQENERRRIARDLHDTTLQNLTHIMHQIELGEMKIDKDVVDAKLELLSVRQNLRNVIDEIRNLIFDLRPMSFDDLGLKETLENLIDIIINYSKYEVKSKIDNIQGSDYFLISIYRIAREALVNAVKHSGGNQILFTCVENEDSVCIIVEDNGHGFSQEDSKVSNHYGLEVMRERVNILKGSMDISSENGTKIIVNIPVVKY